MALLALGGCATVMEGTDQSISINTSPGGAACSLERKGVVLGSVAPTPGSMKVSKSKDDITVRCTKAGFEDIMSSITPKFGGTTFGNIIIGGGVGAIVDAASGANYEYPGNISLTLSEKAK